VLLPTIIFSHDMSAKTDIKQREARDWLRKLEHAVSMRTEIEDKESYVDKDGLVDFDLINRHLVECHSQVLWKRPKAYLQILEGFGKIMDKFVERLPTQRDEIELRKLHSSMTSRMEFYRRKLQGIESYAYTTLQRLDIQRSAVRYPSTPPPHDLKLTTESSYTTLSLSVRVNLTFRWRANSASLLTRVSVTPVPRKQLLLWEPSFSLAPTLHPYSV
jgi:hypothetical protein